MTHARVLTIILLAAVGFCTLLLPAAAQPQTVAGEPVLLRLAFAGEKPQSYIYTAEGHLKFEAPEAIAELAPVDLTESIGFRSEVRFTTTLRSTDAGKAKLNLAIDAMSFEAKGFGHSALVKADKTQAKVELDGKTLFDTTEGKLAQFPFAALVFGRELFVFEIDGLGDLLGISLTGLLSAVSDTPAVQKIFAHIAELAPAFLPEEIVSPGATWTARVMINVPELSLDGGGTLRFMLRGTREVDGHSCACIGARGNIGIADFHLAEALKGIPMFGKEMADMDIPDVRFSGRTAVQGDIYIDVTAMRIEKFELAADLETKLDTGIPNMRIKVLVHADGCLESVEAQ